MRYVAVQPGDIVHHAQVAVVVHDDSRVLFLKRDASARMARGDGTTLALPSLRATAELSGINRAQHALQMLFGPCRAFEETSKECSLLHLTARVQVDEGKGAETICVYTTRVESLLDLPLEEIFKCRRCTPSHAELYPGYEVVEVESVTTGARCSPLDHLIVEGCFGRAQGEASAIEQPRLPATSRQKDATETMDAPTRRAKPLAPGEQPSSMDVQSDHQAHFNSRATPSVDDPLEVMKSLVELDLTSNPAGLKEAQEVDPLCKTIRSWMRDGVNGPVDKEYKHTLHFYKTGCFVESDGILHFRDVEGASSMDARAKLRCVLPDSMRDSFIRACHDGFAHPGAKRTRFLVASRVWWPTIKSDVYEFIGRCPTCLYNKEVVYRGAQHIPENGSHPWSSIQVDLVHLHKARSGMEKALVVYDRFTRDVECYPTKADCSSNDILNLLLFEFIPKHGWPRVIYTDRGSNFISIRAKEWFKVMGIELRAADAHMHTAVAGCERFNHSLREAARACHFDHGYEWDLMLPLLVFWYRQLVHTATGHSPFYLNHGREAVTPWDLSRGPSKVPTSVDEFVRTQIATLHLAWQCTQAAILKREVEQRSQHDSRYQTKVKFKKDDRVLIRQAGRQSKMRMPYVGPFKIVNVLDRDRYEVVGRRSAKKDHHEFHVSRLKLWPEGADEEEVYLSDEYFDVEEVVDAKVQGGETVYRVRWTGYSAAEDSWLAFHDMNGPCARAAMEFIEKRSWERMPPPVPPAQPPVVEPAVTTSADPVYRQVPIPVGASSQSDARDARLAARQARMDAGVQQPGAGTPEAAAPQMPSQGGSSSQSDAREARLAARQRRMDAATSDSAQDAGTQDPGPSQ